MKNTSKKILDDIFEKETSLKDLAEKSEFKRKVPSTFPGGVFDGPMGSSMRIYTKAMKGSVWGEPQNITLSLLKTDVYDRRYFRRKPVTLNEVMRGAYSDANKDFDDMPHSGLTRPRYGVLMEEGGRRDFEAWSESYPFPCQKPVGQVIVKADDFKDSKQPDAVQYMKNGVTTVNIENPSGASLKIDYLMSMERNIIAVNTAYAGISKGLSFRLFRHQDQGHRRYMDENGRYIPKKQRTVVYHPVDPSEPVEYYDYEADADFNGPFEPPKSGSDGRFFWISQRFPAENTFPEGFEYVMMGLVSDRCANVYHSDLKKDLGTKPEIPIDSEGRIHVPNTVIGHEGEYFKLEQSYAFIRNACGVAGTAELAEKEAGYAQLYVAVVTSNEAKDIFAEAKRQLEEAEKIGYKMLAKENSDWYSALYRKRESGRIIAAASEDEKDAIDEKMCANVYKSWSIGHGGFCLPDPSKYEGSASYAAFDMDNQSWHSLPCYNEIFSEPLIVKNQYEPLLMWLKLVETWHDALKRKARDIFALPGMTIAHGYLPPVAPDPWYIENQTLDYCLEVPGQLVKSLWNLWDYCLDDEFLKKHVYPITRDLAIFYEAFARRNYDCKYFNLIPVVESENWGISYQFKYANNTTAALSVFRKILNCAIEGAEVLHVAQDRIEGWREVAENLHPYPKFLVGCSEILAGNPGGMPRWSAGDHEFFTASFPATVADEINLDSPDDVKELMVRTLDTVRTNYNDLASILMGKFKDYIPCGYNKPAVLIKDYKTLVDELIKNPERLINSRSGRIHLFPAVPDWSEVSFKDMLARGGFAVSAAKDKDGIKAVVIKANRTNECRLMNPWPGKNIFVGDITAGAQAKHTIDLSNGECISFDAVKGHEYGIDHV